MGVYSQIIINKGAEVTDDFLITTIKEIPRIILVGYQTIYKPYPVFISSWQLEDNEWEEDNLFSDNIVSTSTWNIQVAENIMTIESNSKDDNLTVELNQQKDGFNVYSESDHNKKMEFKLQAGVIVILADFIKL